MKIYWVEGEWFIQEDNQCLR